MIGYKPAWQVSFSRFLLNEFPQLRVKHGGTQQILEDEFPEPSFRLTALHYNTRDFRPHF